MTSPPSPKKNCPDNTDETKVFSEKNRLIWIDCEMTGLGADHHHLIEIACIVTEGDPNLTIVAESEDIIIHRSDEVIENMSDWCKEQFAKNGLTKAVQESKTEVGEAEKQILHFLRTHVPKGVCPLAGNSVGEDRTFLRKEMPLLAEYIHYRTVDVSTVKELARRWHPKLYFGAPKKKLTHRALDDIRESINELRYYQRTLFVPPGTIEKI